MSEHRVSIIEIGEVRPHGNAERLEIVPVNGWQAVVRKGEFKPGDRAIYIEPDYTVPTALPEFSFLAKDGKERHRLKAVRLRGTLSYGLLIPVPERLRGKAVGSDVMADLGIERYVPEITNVGANELPQDQWPKTHAPKFDLENYERFPAMFMTGEPVVVTEKVHGANARYTFVDGTLYIGSRQRWHVPGEHVWDRAARTTPGIMSWCEEHPGAVLYGEVYGKVQSLTYGYTTKGDVRFIAFAATQGGSWWNQADLFADLKRHDVPAVPVLYEGPFDIEALRAIAEKDSVVAIVPGQIMEGVVIVPAAERFDANAGGRAALKLISARYWESAA